MIQDWIKRDNKTFVHRSSQKRSGWEANVKKGYSEFLLKGKSTLDFLTIAFQVCQNRMRSLARGRNVTLSFHPKDSLTNGQRILVSTEVADVPEMSAAEKLDVMLGLTTHEMLHIIHSDFSLSFESKFHGTVNNVIEDERIEFLGGDEYPGYGAQLEKTKEFYFDRKYKRKECRSAADEIFDCFFKLIRYPKYLDQHLVEKHETFLSKIKDILSPYPSTSDEAFHASTEIYRLFEGELGELAEFANDKSKIAITLKGIADEMEEINSDVNISKVFDENEHAIEVIKGEANFIPETQTFFLKAGSDEGKYRKIQSLVISDARKLAHGISSDFAPSQLIRRGLPSGVLDEAYLVDAIHGYQNVHLNRVEINKKVPRLVFMVDESFSMGGQQILDAQKISITLQKALQMFPGSEYFTYGYASDENTEGTNTITIYHEPGFHRPFGLGTMKAKGSNRDGVCIREVARRVRTFSKSKFLLLVLSDGNPSASGYHGEDGINHTRSMIAEVEADNFKVLQIGIGVNPENQKRMFRNFITYKNSKTMVTELLKAIRPLLRKL